MQKSFLLLKANSYIYFFIFFYLFFIHIYYHVQIIHIVKLESIYKIHSKNTS